MDPSVFGPLIPIVAIIAFAVVKVTQVRATRPPAGSSDVPARLEALERGLEDVQQQLVETQERLDFAERLLTQAREERRIGNEGTV